MIGVAVRVHDRHGDDLGIAHLPPPVEVGDLIALEHVGIEARTEPPEDWVDPTSDIEVNEPAVSPPMVPR